MFFSVSGDVDLETSQEDLEISQDNEILKSTQQRKLTIMKTLKTVEELMIMCKQLAVSFKNNS